MRTFLFISFTLLGLIHITKSEGVVDTKSSSSNTIESRSFKDYSSSTFLSLHNYHQNSIGGGQLKNITPSAKNHATNSVNSNPNEKLKSKRRRKRRKGQNNSFINKTNISISKKMKQLNEHPDQVRAYEIPVQKLPPPSPSPPPPAQDKDNEKANKGKLHVVPPQTMVMPSDLQKRMSLNLNSPQKKEEESLMDKFLSISSGRTLLLAPLVAAAPMMLAEALTIGGVGMAAPAFILLPLLLLPVAAIIFVIYI